MAPKKTEVVYVEPAAATPRFGSALCAATEGGGYVGVHFFRQNNLVVFNPRYRSLQTLKTPHKCPISTLTTFSNGLVATGDNSGRICLMEPASRDWNSLRLIRDYNLEKQRDLVDSRLLTTVRTIADDEGSDILIALHEGTVLEGNCVSVWDRQLKEVLELHDGTYQKYAAISPNASILAIRCAKYLPGGGYIHAGCYLQIANQQTGAIQEVPAGYWLEHDQNSRSFAFSKDSTKLFYLNGQDGDRLDCVCTATGTLLWQSESICKWIHGRMTQTVCSPDGRWIGNLIKTGASSYFTLLDMRTGEIKARVISKRNNLGAAAFSWDGYEIALTHPELGIVPIMLRFLVEKGGPDKYLLMPGDPTE